VPGKAIPTHVIADAFALREAGYTVLSISQRLGIGVRTLQRHFAGHGVKKGRLVVAVIQQARAELLARVTSSDVIRQEAAELVNDDLAHSRHLRTLLVNASAQMKATSLRDAVQVMRAAAAYSTALKNTSDVIRRSLRLDALIEFGQEALPELVVVELTEGEVTRLRMQQANDEMQAGHADGAFEAAL
jgi:hypothetical protein